MPKLKKFLFDIKAKGTGLQYGDFDIGIRHISSLRYLRVGIVCTDARPCEVEVTEAAVRHATSVLPNNLQIEIERHRAGQMVKGEMGIIEDDAQRSNNKHQEEAEQEQKVAQDKSNKLWLLYIQCLPSVVEMAGMEQVAAGKLTGMWSAASGGGSREGAADGCWRRRGNEPGGERMT
uniref:Disease resistance R13L4/SHOC-2-like LRR domain-containing protein n=1 Tax=Leersia perrieri TaxID=77586 RepID=A0A0D9XQZ4_9ORYZ